MFTGSLRARIAPQTSAESVGIARERRPPGPPGAGVVFFSWFFGKSTTFFPGFPHRRRLTPTRSRPPFKPADSGFHTDIPMTKASVAVAAPAKPTGAAKAPKAKADGTKQDPHEDGTLSREDIATVKLEDDGGSSDAHSDDGNVEENGDLDETKRFVRAPPFGAHSIERNVEARRVGHASSTLARPLPF